MMKHNSVEIKSAISQYVNECRSIVNTCKKELRELTEEEQARYDELKALIEEKKGELVELQKELDAIEIPDEEVKALDEDEEKEEVPEEVKDEEEKEKKAEEAEEDEEDKNNIQRNMKKKNFSLLGAIRSIVNNTKMDAVNQAVINAGAKDFRSAGINYGGQIQLPVMENRAAVTVTAEGEDIVATNIFDIIGPLRAKNVLSEAGAKFYTGLVGNVQIPKMSATNVAWAGETAAAADGAGAFEHVTLQPKRLTAYIDLSKQFLLQDGVGAEAMIRQDLINAINGKLEATILGEGVGSGNEPAGMFNGKDVQQVKDFAAVTKLEAGIEANNVFGECKYVVAPTAKAALRAMAKGAKSTQLVYENNEVDGTPALCTTHIPANKLVYGDFSNLAIGSWGAVDLVVDPYTQAANGMVRVVINAYFDAKVLEDNAFAYGTTAIV